MREKAIAMSARVPSDLARNNPHQFILNAVQSPMTTLIPAYQKQLLDLFDALSGDGKHSLVRAIHIMQLFRQEQDLEDRILLGKISQDAEKSGYIRSLAAYCANQMGKIDHRPTHPTPESAPAGP